MGCESSPPLIPRRQSGGPFFIRSSQPDETAKKKGFSAVLPENPELNAHKLFSYAVIPFQLNNHDET